jgi:predicted CoA-binding protein
MKTVAVLGASPEHRKYGNKAVRAYLAAGWKVFPVNLAGEEVAGQPSYRSLAEVPKPLDRVTVYLPPPVTLSLLPEIAAAGAGDVWFNPGSADGAVRSAARELGIPAVDGCSIIAVGMSPAQFP